MEKGKEKGFHQASSSHVSIHSLAGDKSPKGTVTQGEKGVKKEAGRQQVIGGQYFLGETLGKSLFGVVYQGLNSNNGEFVAIKQIPLEDLDPEKVSNITDEIERFKKLDHPNIVRVFDAIPTKKELYLVLELVEGGSVVIMKENFVNLPESLLAKYISKCLKGLAYLHQNRIVHNDIKGVNILINREGQVKLADCVQPMLKGAKDAMAIGQPYWMPPEVIRNNQATTASDVWSLGCTVIELFNGTPPYSNLASMAAVLQIMKDEHPPLPESASPELKEFLLCCLQKDPQKRSSVETLLELPWIKKYRDQDDVLPAPTQSNHLELPKMIPPEVEDPEAVNEEHLTLKVHLSDMEEEVRRRSLGMNGTGVSVPSVNLFVFKDTHAAAMVDVALKKAGFLDLDSALYCLMEIDNVTREERRFNDFDLPRLEAEVLWQFEGEIRFTIKKKSSLVKEGIIQRLTKKGWVEQYYVLDMIERYFVGYPQKPGNRDDDMATHVYHGFHLIKWVYISDDHDNGFVVRDQLGNEEVFKTRSYEEMISWVNQLRFACDIHFLFDED